MRLIRDLNKIRRFKKPVVTLGVFDGLHRAHRVLLQNTVRKAKSIGGTSIALTFFPHPQKKQSLYSLSHRLMYMRQLGVDVAIVIRFNRIFSGISAEDFIKNILVGRIHPEYVYIGRNFRFDCRKLEL